MANKIYALLVGIIDYNQNVLLDNNRVYFPKLNGCVNDAKKIRSFLERNYREDQLHIKELYNSEATKDAICEGVLQHLAQAGEGDSTLFYFSGHGTQEDADACFTTETDKKLESLVAYYDAQTVDRFLIADKELRFLINQLSKNKSNNTVIIDCCHSGDMTRNLQIVEANFLVPVVKKNTGTYTFGQRKWEQFIFHNQFQPEEVKAKGVATLLPEGDHILFSASESNESAYEIGGEGIFTKHLTDILNVTNGGLSNQMLFDRLTICMKYAYLQKPKLYTPASVNELKKNSFLNANGVLADDKAMVFYNSKKGWIINRGEIHGLQKDLELVLYNEDRSLQIPAVVEKPEIDHAILKVNGEADTQATYTTDVNRLAIKTIRLSVTLDDAIPKDVAALMNAISAISTCKIELVENNADADLSLQHLAGMFYLTRKNDRYRPISSVVAGPDFEELITQLQHLAKWKFIEELKKQATVNAAQLLSIEYTSGTTDYQLLHQKDAQSEIKIENWNEEADCFSTTLRVRLSNKSSQDLYVAILYLDINYASDTFLLEPSPYHLNPGDQVDLNVGGNTLLPVQFYTQARYFNYPEYLERFKIIVSAKPFEVYALKLEPLPEPPMPGQMRGGATRNLRRMGGIGRSNSLEGWYVTTVDMISTNPSYNKIPGHLLQEMLGDSQMAPFAEGLYFTSEGTGPFDQDVQLKPEIIIIEDRTGEEAARQRGVIIDLANWWSRKKRNNYYKDITRRFPERTVIVSEGDSWFQHPLVYDIIDHLSKIYAIRCVAAAADTLANYFSGDKRRGDYYLDVLSETKPAFFLISGGGNDILGSQFREFLVDKPYDKGFQGSTNGGVFLKETFGFQIAKLMDIYTSMFGLLQTQFPNMKTIVHGYDYPVHLDYPNKGWLGRYMIEKGIADAGDRRTVIRYIMDEFNTKLSQVVQKFPDSVYYLDVRNTVLYKQDDIDQWYDEIHPNIDGFQSIGLKYIQLIESLKKKAVTVKEPALTL
jgi:hypothetical protein